MLALYVVGQILAKNDVIYYFRSGAVAVTVLRASSSGLLSASAVSSCLHYVIVLLNGSAEFHQT